VIRAVGSSGKRSVSGQANRRPKLRKATCRRLRIQPREYLGAILPGLTDFPAKRVAELAPLVWV
jgi:hypothetical protein